LKSCEFQLTTRCLSRPGGFLLNWRTNPPRIPSTEKGSRSLPRSRRSN